MNSPSVNCVRFLTLKSNHAAKGGEIMNALQVQPILISIIINSYNGKVWRDVLFDVKNGNKMNLM